MRAAQRGEPYSPSASRKGRGGRREARISVVPAWFCSSEIARQCFGSRNIRLIARRSSAATATSAHAARNLRRKNLQPVASAFVACSARVSYEIIGIRVARRRRFIYSARGFAWPPEAWPAGCCPAAAALPVFDSRHEAKPWRQ